FAVVLPAFEVTDDNVRTPGTRKHRARDLAGEGPLGLPMQVLTGNRDVAAARRFHRRRQTGKRRRHHDSAAVGRGRQTLFQGLEEGGGLGRRLMHLPVGDHHRGAQRVHAEGASVSAATPGSVSPARNSSDAPPPVETWVSLSSSPEARSAATESPPPATVTPGQPATARATASVPASSGGRSKTPIGPFQKTMRAGAIARAKAARVAGPISMALP